MINIRVHVVDNKDDIIIIIIIHGYYSWFIKNQDSQPMAELLTILQ